jgi:hypothetical protein
MIWMPNTKPNARIMRTKAVQNCDTPPKLQPSGFGKIQLKAVWFQICRHYNRSRQITFQWKNREGMCPL